MEAKADVVLHTCRFHSLGKHSGFLNLCVKMPLGQNQSHTLRLTLAIEIPSVKTVLFEHLTFQETKQRCDHVLSVITSHVTCLCLYPARAVVGHGDIGWRRCCDCNGSACCWRWHHDGVPCLWFFCDRNPRQRSWRAPRAFSLRRRTWQRAWRARC